MARARNVKPALFKNEELAECDPLARLLFIGLWTLADCEGRLEDRPKRIKAELLPYDIANVDELLDQLDRGGLIRRYEVDGARYIWIPNFSKHQNPHVKEKNAGSDIPPHSEDKEAVWNAPSAGTRPEPDQPGARRADSRLLFPDSGILKPDTPNPELRIPVVGSGSADATPETSSARNGRSPRKSNPVHLTDALLAVVHNGHGRDRIEESLSHALQITGERDALWQRWIRWAIETAYAHPHGAEILQILDYIRDATNPVTRQKKDLGEITRPAQYFVKKVTEWCGRQEPSVRWPEFPVVANGVAGVSSY